MPTKKTAKKKSTKKTVKKKVTAKKKSTKKTTKKKSTVKEAKVKPILNQQVVDKLIDKAKVRGFITEVEIVHAFPQVEEYLEEYEKFLNRVDQLGLTIAEQESGFLVTPDEVKPVKKGKGSTRSKKVIDISDISSDSIQMYLREIGKVSL